MEEDGCKFVEKKERHAKREKLRFVFVEIRRFIETFTALSHRFVDPFTLSLFDNSAKFSHPFLYLYFSFIHFSSLAVLSFDFSQESGDVYLSDMGKFDRELRDRSKVQ